MTGYAVGLQLQLAPQPSLRTHRSQRQLDVSRPNQRGPPRRIMAIGRPLNGRRLPAAEDPIVVRDQHIARVFEPFFIGKRGLCFFLFSGGRPRLRQAPSQQES